MSSNKKRFSLGLAVGLSLGLAGGAAYASSIADTYTTGDTLTAAKMTAIKTAVNDNDTRINNLQGNVPGTSCLTNAGAVDANAVRVGPTCIDKYRQTVTLGGGCFGDGVGCTELPSSSGVAGGGTAGLSWAQAARVCANAGKRLPTPGEWIAARSLGATAGSTVIDTNVDNKAEWLNAAGVTAAATDFMQAGYAGANLSGAGSGVAQMFINANYNLTGLSYIYFRCAR